MRTDAKNPTTATPHVKNSHRNAAETGLPDGFANVIHIHNLFGNDPNTYQYRKEILNEAPRIRKPGRTLYALNNQTGYAMAAEETNEGAEQHGVRGQVHFQIPENENRKLTEPEKRAFLNIFKNTGYEKRVANTFSSNAHLAEIRKPEK